MTGNNNGKKKYELGRFGFIGLIANCDGNRRNFVDVIDIPHQVTVIPSAVAKVTAKLNRIISESLRNRRVGQGKSQDWVDVVTKRHFAGPLTLVKLFHYKASFALATLRTTVMSRVLVQ